VAWQLSYELQQGVLAFTATGPAARDLKYCDQIRESARSASCNIAEGFGRYYPKEFARFLRIANGSLNETKNHLREALDRGYLSTTEYERLIRLNLRAIKATARLTVYLSKAGTPRTS
jgi:four helix bundle protein